MVSRFLVYTENSYYIVTTTGSSQDRLHIITTQYLIQWFRIELTDNLYFVLCFTHHHIYLSSLACFNREEFQSSQNTTVRQTSTCNHHVVTFIQGCTILQQVAPSCTGSHIYITFVVVQKLKSTRFCQFRNREMWIVLRIGQRLDRLVGSHKLTSLCFCSFCGTKVYVSNTIVAEKLYFTGHFINTRRNTQTTCHWHKENVAAMSIGYTSFPNTCRRNRSTTQITVFVYLNVFSYPWSQLIPISLESSLVFFRNSLFKECLVRSQHFISYTRIANETTEKIHVFLIYMWLHVINQYIQANIAQIFGRDALQHVDTTSFRLVWTETCKEVSNHIIVTTRSNQNLGYSIFVQLILLGEFTCRSIGHESSYISITDRIFDSETTVVFCTLFRSYFRHVETFCWRYNIQFNRVCLASLLIKFDFYFIVYPESYLTITKLAIFRCPYQHVTLTSRQESLAFCIALLGSNSIELSIVVYLEFHLSTFYRLACSINNLYISTCKRSIIADDVDFSKVWILMHDFFRTIITAEYFGVHQHTTGCRSVEPTKIKHRFRFTSAQKVPFPVYPSFHPCMVVIGMCPTRSIHLTSRNTYCTESSDCESRLFTTTTISCLYRSQWRTSTWIRRSIYHLLMTPVVDFQYCIM